MSCPLEWSEAIPCITNTATNNAATNGHVNPNGRGLQPVFSPSGLRIAAVVDHTTIVVRDSESFEITSYLQIPDVPSHIEFDASGSLLLVCVPKRSCVSVFSLTGQGVLAGGEMATYTEPLAGVMYATWVQARPSTVLVVSDFGCRMTTWEVTVEQAHEAIALACPKLASGLGVASSPDGSLVGVLARSSCKDRIVVYDSRTFEEVSSLELGTSDAAGMLWSPDSKRIAVWDGVTYGPRVVVVGVSGDATHLDGSDASKSPRPGSKNYSVDVVLDKTWDTGLSGLGVRAVAWSPSGRVLAVGTYDADVFLINGLTWKGMEMSLHHAAVVDEKKYGGTEMEIVVFEESSAGHYVDCNMPVRLPVEDPAACSSHSAGSLLPATGIDRILFSSTGKFLATVCQDKPNVLWIWDASRFELDTVLIHRRQIRDVAWRPGSDALYLVCGTKQVFVFDDGGVTVLSTGVADERFKGMNVQWSKHSVALSCASGYSIGSC